MDAALPQLGDLIEMRLLLLRNLAESLEVSQFALARNDAEAIARGAARQAELCRQWSLLEDQLRREAEHRPLAAAGHAADNSPESVHSAQLEQEWDALGLRIRRLTRVHCSLLRHLQRSLAVLARVLESCAPTYTPEPALLRSETRARAGD
ncbi:MAG: hypothetical protein WAQ52_12900 [Terriglobales bacterium]